ncbi:MAG: DUF4234 domain-containing protein [Archaeoglobus sp.]|nr:DUF4234 domain-containing protein [Archaeoglobus sp.]
MTDLGTIEEYMNRRIFTDYIMPVWLPFIPVLLVIIGILFFTLVFIATSSNINAFDSYSYTSSYPQSYSTYSTYPYSHSSADAIDELGVVAILLILFIMLAGLALNIYVIYKWVSRRNEHFKRQRLLFRAIIGYLRAKSPEDGTLNQLNRLESLLNEIEAEEEEKNAVLWALIQFVPYVGGILLLYVYHFLNKDFWRHERREDHFLDVVSSILVDENHFFYDSACVPNRNTVLYVVLSIVTLGFFGLYWVYTLTKDPNEHFKRHVRWETQLLQALRSLEEGLR